MYGSNNHCGNDEEAGDVRQMKCAERKAEPSGKPALDGVRKRGGRHGAAANSADSK